MRLLVTGSQTWTDEAVIAEAMLDARDNPPEELDRDRLAASKMVLVHGACPKGADTLADKYARRWGWAIEPYPANWRDLGRRAGYVRNEHMVNTYPDLVLAFIRDRSPGSTHCAEEAEKRGIPVRYYRATSQT